MDSCDHLVEFCDSDERLVRGAAEFLSEGFATGCTCVVALTEAHRQRLHALLAESGVQTAQLAAAYRYISIDAESMLNILAPDGKLDLTEFHRTIGGLVQLVTTGGKSVRIVGELVSLLARRGEFSAVIALEEAWNELSRLYAFNLYCLYLTAGLARPIESPCRNHICSIHSREVAASLT